MSNVALFLMGALVTLIVVAATGVLVWGATLDGRYDREQRLRLAKSVEQLTPERELHVVDAA